MVNKAFGLTKKIGILQVESEGDTEMSAIFITPDRKHHGAELTCRAEVSKNIYQAA